ncbi:hypothetical protein J4407_00775 [Candidatus Pacearchaeota archaeon]|nr:hypothetical protein [Candidatus Pacearchaeota archaeon]
MCLGCLTGKGNEGSSMREYSVRTPGAGGNYDSGNSNYETKSHSVNSNNYNVGNNYE